MVALKLPLHLRFLPLILGTFGTLAGLSTVSGLLPNESKAWTSFATAPLTLERLKTLNDLKIGETHYAEGIEIQIAPQSGMALHSLTGLGSPNEISEDGSQEAYCLAGTFDGVSACQKVVVTYEATAETNYEVKATRVWVPLGLVANR
ncbi:MAG: hypothetical protein ACAF41_34315 (plasmid) [Leptolyngbya sp. BL-A-14]